MSRHAAHREHQIQQDSVSLLLHPKTDKQRCLVTCFPRFLDGYVAKYRREYPGESLGVLVIATQKVTMIPTERFYATRNDDGAWVVVDWEDPMHPESMSGGWEARWTADHYNGKHDQRQHQKCPVCAS